jgi:hypothetical protein
MAMKNIALTTLICMLFTQQPAFAGEVYRTFIANRFDLSLDAQYFKSNANYDANGSKSDLPSGDEFQNLGIDTRARFVFFNDLGFYTGLLSSSAQSKSGAVSRSTSAVTHYYAGVDHQFMGGSHWSAYLDASYLFAASTIDATTDTAIGSDGANEAKLSAVLNYTAESARFFGRFGGNFRTEGLSALLLYGLGADYAFGRSRLGLELSGFSSVKDDDYTNSILVRDTVTNRVNAQSRRYYSVNPNLLEAQIYLQQQFGSNTSVKLFAGSTVIGSNTAEGIIAGVSLNWGFGTIPATLRPDDVPNRSSLPDQEPGFKVDTNDGVNQEIFKPVTPPKPKK